MISTVMGMEFWFQDFLIIFGSFGRQELARISGKDKIKEGNTKKGSSTRKIVGY